MSDEHPEIRKVLDDCDASKYTPQSKEAIRRALGIPESCGGARHVVHPPYKGAPEATFSCPGCPDCAALASQETDQPEESNRWRCQRCRVEFATNYRSCPSCGHTVYDPIKERKR